MGLPTLFFIGNFRRFYGKKIIGKQKENDLRIHVQRPLRPHENKRAGNPPRRAKGGTRRFRRSAGSLGKGTENRGIQAGKIHQNRREEPLRRLYRECPRIWVCHNRRGAGGHLYPRRPCKRRHPRGFGAGNAAAGKKRETPGRGSRPDFRAGNVPCRWHLPEKQEFRLCRARQCETGAGRLYPHRTIQGCGRRPQGCGGTDGLRQQAAQARGESGGNHRPYQ